MTFETSDGGPRCTFGDGYVRWEQVRHVCLEFAVGVAVFADERLLIDLRYAPGVAGVVMIPVWR
jgi:hypothetical protein